MLATTKPASDNVRGRINLIELNCHVKHNLAISAKLCSRNKESNLFDDVYLSILAADFFSYLAAGRGIKLGSIEHSRRIAEEWLNGASREYFARDFEIKRGIKKERRCIKN